MNNRLLSHLENNKLLPNSQHGFRKNRSTETALAITTEIIAQALSHHHQCSVVLRDVSKAFDKVWHDGLRYKLHQCNIPPPFTRILSNFLINRKAYISLPTHNGQSFNIYSGVPQGSSLSPTLYTIYTADTPQPAHNAYHVMYADDITQIVIQPGKSRKFLAKKLEREITNINNFEHKWKIQTNTNKFTIIPIAMRKTEPVTINNTHIPYSYSGKILGLHINFRGFSQHIKAMRTKSTAALSNLFRFKALPPKIKLHLIKAYILPMLTYPTYTLNAISRSQQLSLQRIQNKSLRFALDTYPYTKTTEELHSEGKIAPINITLYNRGNKIKNKILNTIQDDIYTHIHNTYRDTSSHGWFKKPLNTLNNAPPQPIFTSL